jgi:hypothetical protein
VLLLYGSVASEECAVVITHCLFTPHSSLRLAQFATIFTIYYNPVTPTQRQRRMPHAVGDRSAALQRAEGTRRGGLRHSLGCSVSDAACCVYWRIVCVMSESVTLRGYSSI